jgi:hypothetical protein
MKEITKKYSVTAFATDLDKIVILLVSNNKRKTIKFFNDILKYLGKSIKKDVTKLNNVERKFGSITGKDLIKLNYLR